MSSGRFPVVLLWHMHQPQYRDALTGVSILPWTYLHAIKDYVDMAAHLEANPGARAVVNFTPVLIEQLEDLSRRVQQHLQHGTDLPDPVLASLGPAGLPADPGGRLTLMQACLRAHRVNLIERYPDYRRLADLALALGTRETIGYANDQYLRDLAVWFHVAWLGETVKREDARVARLIERGHDFGPADCRSLLELIGALLGGVLPRYRRLMERGQVELSASPYGHPILPLLIDFQAARESTPDAPLPHAANYPGGAERAGWHLDESRAVFTRVFGGPAQGCWPSEGAISTPALALIEQHGMRWAATSESVLRGCLEERGELVAATEESPVTRLYRQPGHALNLLFRHDELSDLIGFTYSKWHGDDAVRHFVEQLEHLARRQNADGTRLVLIALDGENAWDYYPFNGFYFLQGLYRALASHPLLELTTPAEFLKRAPVASALPRVVAGSWVHGTLSTWIGDPDKNRGWDRLVEAKQAYDRVMAAGTLSVEQRHLAERQLALCESSDWFWWFGDYNPYEAVRDFDALFRHQLACLYQLLQLPVPANLSATISVGRGVPEAGGVMRRAQD
ncbi:MAG TPA: glycoside hydrolase family 57 protein [Steroidobacteraceae bacterium]|nr:glycoside hydrolase family 57 protein [Steroidobacteraceae bacterium]